MSSTQRRRSCQFLSGVLLLIGALFPPLVSAQSIEGFRREDSTPGFSFELPESTEDAKVNVTAERQEAGENYFLLEGNARIEYRTIVLSADRITYNKTTQDVLAEGNVILDQGTQRLSGDRVVFNLGSETGTVFNARAAFQPSIFFRGETIEKIDEDTYVLTNGIFTSCDLDDPAWSFSLSRGEITVEDYARLEDLSFRARNVPLIWTPYLVWPTRRDRARGFLIPKVGNSSRFGAYLGTAYFIPLGQSADVTLLGDIYSEGYFGLGSEVRYVPSADTEGALDAQGVYDPENDALEWRYQYEHTQENLPGDIRGVIDIEDYSDLNFFQEFSRDLDLLTKSNIYSAAYLTKNAPKYSANLRTERRKYFLGPGEERIYEQLPSLEFRAYPLQLGDTPLYVTGVSSIAHLRTNLGANYYRADLAPTLSMQLRTPPWLSVKPQLQLRETFYTSTVDEVTGEYVDDSLSRFYAQGEVEVVGPSFSRIFAREIGGFSRFKHVIEPRVRYLYTTDVEDQNRVIPFDTIDTPRLPLVRDTVEYSITQRLLAKEGKPNSSAREILSFTVRQSAALSDPIRPSASFQERSAIGMNLRFNPYPGISIDGDTTFEDGSFDLRRTSLSTRLQSSTNPAFFALTWFANFPTERSSFESSQFRVAGGVPILADRIRLAAQVNYDAERQEFLEKRLLIDYAGSCYSIALEYRDFDSFTREGTFRNNRDYILSVSLKNVGTFVDLRGSLDPN